MRVAGRVWPAVSRRFPVVIKLHVNSVHATGRVCGCTSRIARCESVESCIGEVRTRWIWVSTIDGVVLDSIVLVVEIVPLDPMDLHKSRCDLSVSVCYSAGRTRRYPS